MTMRAPRLIGVLAGGAVITACMMSTNVMAAGNGAMTETLHAHGTDAAGLVVADFLPGDGPPLPAGCWLDGSSQAIASTYGNAILHMIGNKTGFWLTTTYAGDAAVYPVVFDGQGNPVIDPNSGNVVVDSSQPPAATGHLTIWFGVEDNLKNEVDHATLSFHGITAAGDAVSLTAHFQFATNAAGQVVATPTGLSC